MWREADQEAGGARDAKTQAAPLTHVATRLIIASALALCSTEADSTDKCASSCGEAGGHTGSPTHGLTARGWATCLQHRRQHARLHCASVSHNSNGFPTGCAASLHRIKHVAHPRGKARGGVAPMAAHRLSGGNNAMQATPSHTVT